MIKFTRYIGLHTWLSVIPADVDPPFNEVGFLSVFCSKAFGGAQNNYQYQGDYSEFDDDLGWNDFMLRSYDPQIGRFLQHDPYDEYASGYVGMGNEPANLTDPSGGCTNCFTGVSATLQSLFGTLTPVSVIARIKTPLNTITSISSITSKGLITGFQIFNSISRIAEQTLNLENDKGDDRNNNLSKGAIIPIKDNDGTLLGELDIADYRKFEDPKSGGVYIRLRYISKSSRYVVPRYIQTIRTNKHKNNPIDGTIYTFNDPWIFRSILTPLRVG